MLLLILGIIDIIAAAVIWVSTWGPLTGNVIVMTFGIIMLLKGIYSILMMGGKPDPMGILDIIAAVFMLLSFYGMAWPFFFYIALLILLKGLYTGLSDFITTFLRGN